MVAMVAVVVRVCSRGVGGRGRFLGVGRCLGHGTSGRCGGGGGGGVGFGVGGVV